MGLMVEIVVITGELFVMISIGLNRGMWSYGMSPLELILGEKSSCNQFKYLSLFDNYLTSEMDSIHTVALPNRSSPVKIVLDVLSSMNLRLLDQEYPMNGLPFKLHKEFSCTSKNNKLRWENKRMITY